MTTSVVPKILACATEWFRGRQPELIGAPVPLLHLHAANPERRVLRGLAFNACDGKVLSIHPDSAANREFGRPLGIDLQNIAVTAIRDFGSNQAEIVVLGNDPAFPCVPPSGWIPLPPQSSCGGCDLGRIRNRFRQTTSNVLTPSLPRDMRTVISACLSDFWLSNR